MPSWQARAPITLEIRDATPADADTVAELHLASWRTAYRGIVSDAFLDGPARANRLATWRQRFSPDHLAAHRVRLAESRGAPAGFANVATLPDPAWGYMLDNLHVRPDLKNRGIGRRLIADAAAWVVARGDGLPLYLWVYEANAPSRAFYDRLGGAAEGRVAGRAPDGGPAASLRYVWRDPATLCATSGTGEPSSSRPSPRPLHP